MGQLEDREVTRFRCPDRELAVGRDERDRQQEPAVGAASGRRPSGRPIYNLHMNPGQRSERRVEHEP